MDHARQYAVGALLFSLAVSPLAAEVLGEVLLDGQRDA